MIHVLVVDDEPILVNSLYQMLKDDTDWPLMVFKAMSGSQALEIARNNRVDVMLTDICMPNIDGLSLQRLVQAEWPHCRVVFLTGYDSFEYAQQAIRQNGAAYVLKVEGDSVIMDALEKCIGEIESERENQMLLDRVKSALPLLQREFVNEMLQGRQFSNEEMKENIQMMEFPLQADQPALMILAKVRRFSTENKTSAGLGGVFSIISIMDQYLGNYVRHISVTQPQDTIVTLYQPQSGSNWQSAYRHTIETLEEIQESGLRLVGLDTAFTVASMPCQWNGIAQKLADLETVARIYAFDDRSIITDEAMNKAVDSSGKLNASYENIIPTQHQLAHLRILVSNGDEENMTRLLREFSLKLRAEDVPIGVARDIYYSLAIVFQRCINDMNTLPIKWLEDPGHLMNMEAHFSWSKVFEYFENIGRSITSSRSNEKIARNKQLVEHINEYVKSHLSDDMGLDVIANRYHFHPSYLARLYKHLCGITLGQYIVNVKLNHAKAMLSKPEYQINDIAKALGFSTVAYFGKFFKTHCGQAPSEYRRQASSLT